VKRGVLPALVALNVVLAAVLAWLWVGADGKLRNTQWTAPAAVRPDFSGPLAKLAIRRSDEAGMLVAMQERPLFSPTRRPPPPPPPPAAPDPMANVQLLGVHSNDGVAGIIARVDGRVRRLAQNEKVGDWTLQKIEGGEATFARAGESRVLRLARPLPSAAAPAAIPAGAAAPAGLAMPGGVVMPGSASVRGGLAIPGAMPGTPTPGAPPMTGAQRAEEEERARQRARGGPAPTQR
jgi:hypothetical protein